MSTPQQSFVAILAIVLVISGAVSMRSTLRMPGRLGALTLALCALTLGGRLLWVEPTLLHANFHAAALVDSMLAWPAAASHRTEYGQGSFVVLGALARVLGGGFDAIVLANQLFAVATLGVLGVYAARICGRPVAMPLVVLLGAAQPALVRVAASEDAHTLATFLAAVSLLSLDVAARERRRAPLFAGVAAAFLMMWTRQTLYPAAIGVVALAWVRRGDATRPWRIFDLAAAAVIGGLVFRVWSTASHGTDALSLQMLPVLLSEDPRWLATGHPLLMTPGLVVAAAVGVGRMWDEWTMRLIALSVAGLLVLTLPFAMPTAGVLYPFRVPVVALCLVPAAVALAWTSRALYALPLAAWPIDASALRGTTAATSEMRALAKLARELPPDAVIVTLPRREPMPSYSLPHFALPDGVDTERAGRPTHDPARPRFWWSGLQCHAYSLAELVEADSPGAYLRLALHRVTPTPPPGGRSECAGWVIHEGVTVSAPHDAPFAFFDADSVAVGFVRQPNPASDESQSAAPKASATSR